MKKLLFSFFVFLSILFFSLAAKSYFFGNHSPSLSAIRIDSFPQTTVFINDKEVGKTSFFSDNLTPGEIKIKLISAGGVSGTFVSWESKLKLVEDTLTYVSRNLGSSEDLSSGQTIFLEKLNSPGSREILVVSTPDFANFSIDSQDQGKSQKVLRDLTPGNHEIIFSLLGYSDEVVHAKVINGYRTNVVVKLAQLFQKISSPSALARPIADLISSKSGEVTKPYVIIKETGLGFLRVRSDPRATATEVAKIKPGEKYALLSEVSNWVKIKLPTIFGWVSDSYVEKIK